MSFYHQHLFFCINQKEQGRKCCAQGSAQSIFLYAKTQIAEINRVNPDKQIRVSHSGCLGRCAQGPCLVIYPEGIWYTYQTQHDINEIISQHVLQGKKVESLLLSSP